MKKTNATVITIIASLITIVFLILTNEIAISIRLNELSSSLQDIDRTEGSIDNIGLVATYEIHKKLFENRISQEEADAIEQRINSLAILEKSRPPQFDLLFAIISYPALTMINFNRMILGKMPLVRHYDDDSGHVNIDLAYYYERNFLFQRAIKLYDESLINNNLNSSLKAGVLLHQGYCYALSENNDMARKNYLTVINKYGQESSAITATILLGYLEGFRLARERVLNKKEDLVSTSQSLVNLLAYQQALSMLKTAELEARTEDLPRIKYYIARCFAGMGDTNKAVEKYLQVITSSPSSRYAVFSNRKLFMTGSSGGDDTIQNISIELNKKLNDPVLNKMVENKGKIKTKRNIHENMITIDIPQNLKPKVADLISNKDKTGLKNNKHYIIFTSDGNMFKGTLIEQTADHIALKSSIGRINVKKNKVTKVTEK